ncbi:hypothetical protein [Methylobacterium sp. E-045]|uniref:hypothetical protein n=1 Tax=Methylobacterium sp. E-045 TaxID=2836575 RepID=UPI001FBADA29|nr:hypothetical protein [Methylobacterium sp. E-045]MCJ2131578.1 hypothetical protein [Methylobacterium sp. E-045]
MAASEHPTIRFPLRITEVGEAIAMLDALETHCAYVYHEDEPIRRSSAKRVTKAEAEAEAVEMATVIARALTAEFGEP